MKGWKPPKAPSKKSPKTSTHGLTSKSRTSNAQNHIKRLALNDSLINRAAWKWLKLAKARPDPYRLHLLTLAWWGLDNGAQGDWPEKERYALELQLGYLSGWSPEDVLGWLFENPNGPGDTKEQEESLLIWLKGASSPLSAAGGVLSVIWSRQQAALWTS